MKILHALGWYFPETLGGTEIYVKALADRQKANRHDVEIAVPKPGAPQTEPTHFDGIPVLRYPTPQTPTRDEAQGRLEARGSEHFRNYLEASRPDILHVHTLTTGLGVHELERASELGIKTVVTNHLGSVGFLCQRGTLMRWGEHPCDGVVQESKCAACELQNRGFSKAAAWTVALAGQFSGSLGSRLPGKIGTAMGMTHLIAHNQTLQHRMLETVDRFVLLNRAAREVVVQNGGDPKKLDLNYLGLSHQDSRRKPSPAELPTKRPVTLGYLGRFIAIKGVLDLARAVASLPKELAFRLVIRAPFDDEATQVRKRFDAIAGNDARIDFAPAVPPDQVPEVLTSYDVLCVPSVWFENGPTVVSESHAVGTPVIGTRIGAMPELIEDGVNGALTDPGDWKALADILGGIVAKPNATIDVWRDALPPARTMNAVAEDYEALYREVLD